MRTRRLLVVATVVAGTLVTGSALPAAARSATRATDKKADQKQVKALVVRASDTPAGWTRQPSSSSSDSGNDKALNSLAAKCGTSKKAFSALKKFETAKASRDWASADSSQLSSEAQIYTTKKVADKGWKLVSECLLDGFIAYLDEQMKANAPTGGTIEPGATGKVDSSVTGVPTRGRTQTMTISGEGQSIPVAFTFVFLHKGRAIETLMVVSINDEFSSSDVNTLLATLGKRLQKV